MDSVGEELNANGHFTSYKRKRSKKKISSRVGRTKCCRTDFGASLSSCSFSVFCSIAYLCRFRGGPCCLEERPECDLQHLRPVFLFLCVETYRDRHLFAALFVFVSIYFVPTVGCNFVLCYLFAFISTYSLLFLPVSLSIRVLCVERPCPCVIRGRA